MGLQCILEDIEGGIRNLAHVAAYPINPDGTPTNQAEVDAQDVAHVTTEALPDITLRKYVQDAEGAPVYDPNSTLTLGLDAQDAANAAYITYDGDACIA